MSLRQDECPACGDTLSCTDEPRLVPSDPRANAVARCDGCGREYDVDVDADQDGEDVRYSMRVIGPLVGLALSSEDHAEMEAARSAATPDVFDVEGGGPDAALGQRAPPAVAASYWLEQEENTNENKAWTFDERRPRHPFGGSVTNNLRQAFACLAACAALTEAEGATRASLARAYRLERHRLREERRRALRRRPMPRWVNGRLRAKSRPKRTEWRAALSAREREELGDPGRRLSQDEARELYQ